MAQIHNPFIPGVHHEGKYSDAIPRLNHQHKLDYRERHGPWNEGHQKGERFWNKYMEYRTHWFEPYKHGPNVRTAYISHKIKNGTTAIPKRGRPIGAHTADPMDAAHEGEQNALNAEHRGHAEGANVPGSYAAKMQSKQVHAEHGYLPRPLLHHKADSADPRYLPGRLPVNHPHPQVPDVHGTTWGVHYHPTEHERQYPYEHPQIVDNIFDFGDEEPPAAGHQDEELPDVADPHVQENHRRLEHLSNSGAGEGLDLANLMRNYFRDHPNYTPNDPVHKHLERLSHKLQNTSEVRKARTIRNYFRNHPNLHASLEGH